MNDGTQLHSSHAAGVRTPYNGVPYFGIGADTSQSTTALREPTRDIYVFVPGGVRTRDSQRAAHARLHLRLTAAEATPNALRERILSSLPAIDAVNEVARHGALDSQQVRWALRVVSADATGTVALEALPPGVPIPLIPTPPPASALQSLPQHGAALSDALAKPRCGFSCVVARPAYEASAATTQACDWVDVRIALRELHLATMRNVEETFSVPTSV